jgi:CBS-domain-containing membrane protein
MLMADDTRAERLIADAMVTYPKMHGPGSGLAEIRAFFEDDHVRMALIVATDGRLVTTIEQPDLAAATWSAARVAKLGTLTGRTAGPADPLGAATAALLREGRRRLAVVDDSGRLLGLLCLKRDGTGYCSDEGIRERAQRAAQPQNQQAGWPRTAGSRR